MLYRGAADSPAISYFDTGNLTVLRRHRRDQRLRRPLPLVALDPPAMEVDDPQNYEGFVPIAPTAP